MITSGTNMHTLTNEKMKILIKETVLETLLLIGFDVSDHEEVVRHQQDRAYLRNTRLRAEALGNNSLQHIIFMLLSAVGAAAILGLAQVFGVRT